MRKDEKMSINNYVQEQWTIACKELHYLNGKRLRYCTARVFETTNYYFLESYNTIVAFIDKRTDTLYDILRFIYGYTPTSAMHIAKFRIDYGSDKWGCHEEYRWVK